MERNSKFAILSDVVEGDDIAHSIETLKTAIRDLPGPSNLHGPVHEKRQGKGGGPKLKALGTNVSSRNQPKGVTLKKDPTQQKHTFSITNKPGPSTVMEEGPVPNIFGTCTDYQAHTKTQMVGQGPQAKEPVRIGTIEIDKEPGPRKLQSTPQKGGDPNMDKPSQNADDSPDTDKGEMSMEVNDGAST